MAAFVATGWALLPLLSPYQTTLPSLFSGMIVSAMSEALLYQVETTQEELDRENVKLAMRLRTLLDEDIRLSEIPERMLASDDVHSPLTTFNYQHFYYL